MSRVRLETYVLTMPDEGDLFIAALTVIEAFIKMASEADNPWRARMYLENVNPKFGNMIPEGFKSQRIEIMEMFDGPAPEPEDVDVRFRFNKDHAYRISENAKMHVTQAFGIMFGCEPESIFPFIRPLPGIKKGQDVLIVEGKDGKWDTKVLTALKHWVESSKCSISLVDHTQMTLMEAYEAVSEVEMVVGPTCAATYLAAMAGKAVVELYPEDQFHRGWLAKFGCGPYYMVPSPNTDPDLFMRALKVAWTTITHRTD